MDKFDIEMHRYRLAQEAEALDNACFEVEEVEYSNYETTIQSVPTHGPEFDEQGE